MSRHAKNVYMPEVKRDLYFFDPAQRFFRADFGGSGVLGVSMGWGSPWVRAEGLIGPGAIEKLDFWDSGM